MRSRPEFEVALLEDLEWLGLPRRRRPDSAQSDDDAPYADGARAPSRRRARLRLRLLAQDVRGRGRDDHGRRWHGPGCPGGCRPARTRRAGPARRARRRLGDAGWTDSSARARTRSRTTATRPSPTATGTGPTDLRSSSTTCARAWTSSSAAATCSATTAAQIRLGARLGRETPATFAHHPLIRRPDGRKLSKADGATSVRDLRAAGHGAAEIIEMAAMAVGRPNLDGIEHGRPDMSHHR